MAASQATRTKTYADFRAFSQAGRYRVTKMKFAKTKDPVSNKNVNDKSTVTYNDANLWATETMGNPKYLLELETA